MVCVAPAAARAAEPFSLHDAVGAPKALSLSGSMRLRYEALENQARPGFRDPDSLVLLRTILTAEYHAGPLRLVGELWDSRAYAGHAGGAVSTGEVDALEFMQAYAAAKLDSHTELQAGRFLMNLGSRRLIAADDYRNTTNGFTGLRLTNRRGKTSSEAFYVLPQTRLPDDQPSILKNRVRWDRETTDLIFWGAAVAQGGLPHGLAFDAHYLGLDEHDAPTRPTRDRALRTMTARLMTQPAPGHFDVEAEYSYQYGHVRAGTQANAALLDVSADFTHLEVGYSFRHPWKPRLSLEYERASGDDGKASFGRFDPLYGARRADLAPSSLYSALIRANIDSPVLRLEATPDPRWDLMLDYREMWLASRTDSFSATNVRDPSGRSGAHAGSEWEGRIRWWLAPQTLRLEVNGILLHKGRFLKDAPNAPHVGDTRYLSVALQTNF